jgi:hypothetical protein
MTPILLALLLSQVTPVTQVDPRRPTARPYALLPDGGVAVVVAMDGLVFTSAASSVASAANPGTCVSVAASTTVLAANAARRSAVMCARITNTDTVHYKLGATATTANFPLEPGQCRNMPGSDRVYTGVIDAIAASGTQSVCVEELN